MRMLRPGPMLLAMLLAMLLLSGCATPYRTVSRPVVHPARSATKPVPKSEASGAEPMGATPVATKAAPASAKAAAPEPGSSIPLMGFRPMKGQAVPGA